MHRSMTRAAAAAGAADAALAAAAAAADLAGGAAINYALLHVLSVGRARDRCITGSLPCRLSLAHLGSTVGCSVTDLRGPAWAACEAPVTHHMQNTITDLRICYIPVTLFCFIAGRHKAMHMSLTL